MANPKPFSLYVPAEDLDLLAQKLTITRLPDEPTGYTLEQGVPLSTLTRLLTHWRTAFLPSWRAHEAALNELPMFTLPVATTDFGTLDVHFVHARSDVAGAIPLLFLHGWPGSFLEVQKLLPLLTGAGRDEGEGEGEGEGPAFHVVAPSLPNYGFSEGLKEVRSSLPPLLSCRSREKAAGGRKTPAYASPPTSAASTCATTPKQRTT